MTVHSYSCPILLVSQNSCCNSVHPSPWEDSQLELLQFSQSPYLVIIPLQGFIVKQLANNMLPFCHAYYHVCPQRFERKYLFPAGYYSFAINIFFCAIQLLPLLFIHNAILNPVPSCTVGLCRLNLMSTINCIILSFYLSSPSLNFSKKELSLFHTKPLFQIIQLFVLHTWENIENQFKTKIVMYPYYASEDT